MISTAAILILSAKILQYALNRLSIVFSGGRSASALAWMTAIVPSIRMNVSQTDIVCLYSVQRRTGSVESMNDVAAPDPLSFNMMVVPGADASCLRYHSG